MKRLSETIRVFREACVNHDQLKEAFLDPGSAGVSFLDARESFFACQPGYETARQTLTTIIRNMHSRGRLISNYSKLTTDLRVVVLRALREEELEDLLDTRCKIRSFDELVKAWYTAKFVADIAEALRDARYHSDDSTFDQALIECSKERGEAGELVFANYEETLDSLSEDGGTSWETVRMVTDDARRHFELLSDEIVEAVDRLRASGDWEDERESLTLDVWRALRAYLEVHVHKAAPTPQSYWQREQPDVEVDVIEHSAS